MKSAFLLSLAILFLTQGLTCRVSTAAPEGARGERESADIPSRAELAEATYEGFEGQGQVTLEGGRWEGEPVLEGGASIPTVWLSNGFLLSGDLDGDGSDEAVVHLSYSSGGSGNFGYLAVMGREGGHVVQKAIGLVGDRVQIRAARIAHAAVVLEVLQAGPGDGMCCPTQLAKRTFAMQHDRLVETAIQVTGTVSLATLQSSVWVLLEDVDYGGQRPTLLFEPGQVSGSTGCNRYHGPVVAGETVTSLTIGPLSVTRKVCPEPLMARERDFLRALEEAGFYRFGLGRLVLSGPRASLLFSTSRNREH